MRVGAAGAERPVALHPDGRHLDLSGVIDDINSAFFAADGLNIVRTAMAADSLPQTDVSGQRIGPPIARPGAVLCIGMNYAAHAAEAGSPPPRWPVMFYKAPNTIVGPDDQVLVPRGSAKTDWEVELAVVIGRRVRYLDSPDEALAHVAGYTLSNDVSERALQLEVSGGQWSKGKSCETFNPLGPWLVTTDDIPNPQDLGLRSWVNGETRQMSNTKDMVFDVATLIYELSQVTVLEPGDVINTGTPEGVALSGRFPFLADGDVIELEIDGLGRQCQRVGRA
jgi:2-keto-4-pentenoate hydratase/2-oxohepta-3-ene-1,7-dioic acid hydratase in catechol pathway